MKSRLLAAAIVAATCAIAVSLLASAQIVALPALATALSRWVAIVLIAALATSQRSLTTWIFVGLLAGAEFGHDWPFRRGQLATPRHDFLRLIKVIIAPLLFGVLVVGIAGHADLKKVGRLGIKSLIYFEAVSTIAMLIGYAAIRLSRAGKASICAVVSSPIAHVSHAHREPAHHRHLPGEHRQVRRRRTGSANRRLSVFFVDPRYKKVIYIVRDPRMSRSPTTILRENIVRSTIIIPEHFCE